MSVVEGKIIARSRSPKKSQKRTCSRKKSPYFKKDSESAELQTQLKSLGAGTRVKWKPPRSPHNLIQEELYSDPWKLLVATIFLNKTRGTGAIPNLMKFFDKWPSAESLNNVELAEVSSFLQPIGLQNVRAKTILRFSGNITNSLKPVSIL